MSMSSSHVMVSDRLDPAKIRPIQDLVLLEDIRRENTSGGIIIPNQSNQGTECRMARVVKVGNGIACARGAFFFPIQLDVGDVALCMEYAAEKLDLQARGKYRFVRSSFIWARVKLKGDKTYDIAELEPRFDSYLIAPEEEDESSGGIILPNGWNRVSSVRKGTVMAVGPGRWDSECSTAARMVRSPMQFAVGEKIIMTRFAGAEVEVNGRWMRLIQECDIQVGLED